MVETLLTREVIRDERKSHKGLFCYLQEARRMVERGIRELEILPVEQWGMKRVEFCIGAFVWIKCLP